ncbi:MAG: sirohydrochlorin cobaltochelatase [Bacteroidales bacterium]|nr:sirohydrochlorin cobaltochelatase [Bacteroidales bacterium]
MKKIFLLILLLSLSRTTPSQELSSYQAADFRQDFAVGDKAALLMVHFGTTYDDTRTKTIDAVNERVRNTFTGFEVRESYTSRIVRRRLMARGIVKDTPLEALLRLRAEGYTHVIVQSTNLIDGLEMASLRAEVEQMAPFFKEIRLGQPLLSSVDDALRVTDILTRRYPAARRSHVLFVGHGSESSATALYSQLDYMMKSAGRKDCHVGTIEGYPTFSTALAEIRSAGARQVTLVPLMLVAGDHATNDIAVDWRERLEAVGLQVNLSLEGLGEIPEIQDIYLDHIRFAMQYRHRPVVEKKNIYARQTD